MARELKKGIRVAKRGGTTIGATAEELNFNSGLNTFKFYKTIKMRVKFPIVFNVNNVVPLKIAHNLNYPPSYIIYTVDNSGTLRNPEANTIGSFSDEKYIWVAGNDLDGYLILLIGADNLEEQDS